MHVRTLRMKIETELQFSHTSSHENATCTSGVGEGSNLGVILVRVCEPVFQNLPHSYTWPLKKRTH